jgi:hypothetical protein
VRRGTLRVRDLVGRRHALRDVHCAGGAGTAQTTRNTAGNAPRGHQGNEGLRLSPIAETACAASVRFVARVDPGPVPSLLTDLAGRGPRPVSSPSRYHTVIAPFLDLGERTLALDCVRRYTGLRD